MDLARLLTDKREGILEVARRNGVKTIRVFGSASRGEGRDDSDVDFLVELDQGRSLLDHSRLVLELEGLLGRKVHVVTPSSLHRTMRDAVLADARPL
ncbi:MAG: nucleotidyltransferase domain-containing protein [Actinomycetota bacterium]|nr:nucleotidyltransferase domain-containing protein [Actinomycetota bacterium]